MIEQEVLIKNDINRCKEDIGNYTPSELNIFNIDDSADTQVKTNIANLLKMAQDLGKIEGDIKLTSCCDGPRAWTPGSSRWGLTTPPKKYCQSQHQEGTI